MGEASKRFVVFLGMALVLLFFLHQNSKDMHNLLTRTKATTTAYSSLSSSSSSALVDDTNNRKVVSTTNDTDGNLLLAYNQSFGFFDDISK